MLFKKVFLCLVLLLSASISQAAPAWYWSMEVGYMISHDGGFVEVMFFKDGAPYKMCNNDVEYFNYHYGALETDRMGNIAKQQMSSALMAAYASGSKVSVVVNCDNNILHAVRLDRE